MTTELAHPFLQTYLRYVEDTESPRLYHLWAVLSCVAAAMGRRCWLDAGIEHVFPNMYVALCGPPAMRKGSAIKAASNLLKGTTKVKFAPNDTGGQRQGIIKAMLEEGNEEEEQELLEALSNIREKKEDTFNSISQVDLGLQKLAELEFDTRDPHTMFATAGELNSLIGENNTQLLTFLQEMWDGVPYKYTLKNTTLIIQNAVLNILAGTTATQMSLALPAQAIGGGFTSRIIFVHGDTQYKRIARPQFDVGVEPQLREVFREVFTKFEGEFKESKRAFELYNDIYYRGAPLNDPRFLHYLDRRGRHLNKVAMALAASRGTMTIDEIDVDVADKLMLLTESKMPDALGEYGMAKTGAARQRVMEFIKSCTGPIPVPALYGIVNKDMTQLEFRNCLADLHSAKKISLVQVADLGQCVVATDQSATRKARREVNDLVDLLKSA